MPEKATHPTSQYLATCDTFDQVLTARLHPTEDTKETKLLIDLGGKRVSLYREDVDMLRRYLEDILYFVELRNPE